MNAASSETEAADLALPGVASTRTQAQAEPASSERITQLDGLRCFAFLSVFAWHAASLPSWLPLWAGVDVFFVLSGYLITRILLRARGKNAREFFGGFYIRRARRILPAYALFLLTAAALFPFDWSRIWYWHAFFLSDVGEAFGWSGGFVLGALWSLSVEEHFYLLWPLAVYRSSIKTLRVVLIGIICAVPILRGIGVMYLSATQIALLTPFRIDLLAAGALLALQQHDGGHLPQWLQQRAKGLVLFSALAFVAASFAFPTFSQKSRSVGFAVFGYELILCVAVGVLCVLLNSKNAVWQRLLTRRWLVYMGTISYMLYLIHGVAIQLSVRAQHALAMESAPERWAWRAVALAGSIAFAGLSWRYFERPLLGQGRRAK